MRTRKLLTLSLLLLLGCKSFQGSNPVDVIPASPPERERYVLWSADQEYKLHSLRVTTDSVSGVLWWRPPECDSCRVHFAKASVDSVNLKEFDSGRSQFGAALLAAFLFLGYALGSLPGET